MADQRKSRDEESRTSNVRKDRAEQTDSWTPASQLPMPNPQPGWAFRYIRVRSRGQDDMKNVSQRFREGWEPVTVTEHPEMQGHGDGNTKFADGNGVEIGGLLLCKIPVEKMEARKRYYEERAAAQMKAVNKTYMQDNDPRMPKLNESKSRTEFRRG